MGVGEDASGSFRETGCATDFAGLMLQHLARWVVDLCFERGSLQVEERCGWGSGVRGKDKILDLNVDKLDMPGGHLNGDVHFDYFGH